MLLPASQYVGASAFTWPTIRTRLIELLRKSEANSHGLDAQLHQKQQIICGQELLHLCGYRFHQRIALKTIALDSSLKHVQKVADRVCLPVEKIGRASCRERR